MFMCLTPSDHLSGCCTVIEELQGGFLASLPGNVKHGNLSDPCDPLSGCVCWQEVPAVMVLMQGHPDD